MMVMGGTTGKSQVTQLYVVCGLWLQEDQGQLGQFTEFRLGNLVNSCHKITKEGQAWSSVGGCLLGTSYIHRDKG